MKRLICILLSSCILPVAAQHTSDTPGIPSELFPPPDSMVRYAPDSSRLLFTPADSFAVHRQESATAFWGFSLLFSPYGLGAGVLYHYRFSPLLRGFLNLDISGIRKTDEFEYYYPGQNQFLVPDKINRLYTLPLTIGVQYRLFQETFAETFQPFLLIGVGPGIIAATPYRENRQPDGAFIDFWSALGDVDLYIRPAVVGGMGIQFTTFTESLAQFTIRYYYVPFGNPGLESIAGIPITNFGGLFLALTFLLGV